MVLLMTIPPLICLLALWITTFADYEGLLADFVAWAGFVFGGVLSIGLLWLSTFSRVHNAKTNAQARCALKVMIREDEIGVLENDKLVIFGTVDCEGWRTVPANSIESARGAGKEIIYLPIDATYVNGKKRESTFYHLRCGLSPEKFEELVATLQKAIA